MSFSLTSLSSLSSGDSYTTLEKKRQADSPTSQGSAAMSIESAGSSPERALVSQIGKQILALDVSASGMEVSDYPPAQSGAGASTSEMMSPVRKIGFNFAADKVRTYELDDSETRGTDKATYPYKGNTKIVKNRYDIPEYRRLKGVVVDPNPHIPISPEKRKNYLKRNFEARREIRKNMNRLKNKYTYLYKSSDLPGKNKLIREVVHTSALMLIQKHLGWKLEI